MLAAANPFAVSGRVRHCDLLPLSHPPPCTHTTSGSFFSLVRDVEVELLPFVALGDVRDISMSRDAGRNGNQLGPDSVGEKENRGEQESAHGRWEIGSVGL
jgi:hypothetical protein